MTFSCSWDHFVEIRVCICIQCELLGAYICHLVFLSNPRFSRNLFMHAISSIFFFWTLFFTSRVCHIEFIHQCRYSSLTIALIQITFQIKISWKCWGILYLPIINNYIRKDIPLEFTTHHFSFRDKIVVIISMCFWRRQL